MALYAWNTDYATTIAGTPIATKQFVNFKDNEFLRLYFTTQNAGDYLWTLSSPSESVGVWRFADSDHASVAYWNGSKVSGDYQCRIYYR